MSSLREFAARQLLRLPGAYGLWARMPGLGSLEARVEHGVLPYPHYAFGVYWSALLAARLQLPRIAVIEFGVAGGNGLLALERVAAECEAELGVAIDVVGFDSGAGMPAPLDYRDLPHIWGEGFYRMVVARLQARLQRAQLVLGDVHSTVAQWRAGGHAPIGFVAFDLDYYSATVQALRIFEDDFGSRLPRVMCYFDDVTALPLGCMNPHVGELLAIEEFNAAHAKRKICRIEQLRVHRPRWERWQERIYACHDFEHPRYAELVVPRSARASQLPLH